MTLTLTPGLTRWIRPDSGGSHNQTNARSHDDTRHGGTRHRGSSETRAQHSSNHELMHAKIQGLIINDVRHLNDCEKEAEILLSSEIYELVMSTYILIKFDFNQKWIRRNVLSHFSVLSLNKIDSSVVKQLIDSKRKSCQCHFCI